MATRKLERDRAYDKLRSMVLNGKVGLAEPLSERSLAASLKFGRTPIREAMHRLVSEGLLQAVPTRGTFLRQLSFEEVRDMYQARHAVECTGAYLAAQRGGSDALRGFTARFETLLAAGAGADSRASQDLGAEFHLELFRAAGNGTLLAIFRNLQAQIALSLALTRHHDHARVYQAAVEHLDLLQAVLAGDPELAQTRMAEHLAHGLGARARVFGMPDAVPFVAPLARLPVGSID